MIDQGAKIQGFDPTVANLKAGMPENVKICSSPIEATVGAAALVVLTEWEDFKWVSPMEVAAVINGKQLIDARNLLNHKDWERVGFDYQGIGR